MKIAIIGAGNVGSALAKGFARAGHMVFLGVRDTAKPEVRALSSIENIQADNVLEAILFGEVILFSVPPETAVEIASEYKHQLRNKVIIDATNSVFKRPEPYQTALEGIKNITGCKDVVKCFNTTGFENMENPNYGGASIDMFTAGSSASAKKLAGQLAKDIGFEECYDFGGDDKVELLEQFALSWINLAIMQKYGRNIAFKILRRE